MRLHEGKMTIQELADWFGVKLSTYRRTSVNYLKKLEDYCEFERIYGGIDVKTIYMYEYDKDIQRKVDKIFLKATREAIRNGEGLQSISGLAEQYKYNPVFANLSEHGIRRQLTKARDSLFGTIPVGERVSTQGKAGTRKIVWAIKLGRNLYRHLTVEEQDLLKNLEDIVYGNIKDEKAFFEVHHLLLTEEITFEAYKKIVQSNGWDFFANVINEFTIRTSGLTLVRVNEYDEEVNFIDMDAAAYVQLLTKDIAADEK